LDQFLAVTREEIQAAAKKYLRIEKRAIVFRLPVKASAPAPVGKKEAA
jgi:predicted Zn-dependent peptidase